MASKRGKNALYSVVFFSLCALCLIAMLTLLSVLLFQQQGYTLIASVSFTTLGLTTIMIATLLYMKHQSHKVKQYFVKDIKNLTSNRNETQGQTQAQEFASSLKHDALSVAQSSLAAFIEGFMDDVTEERLHKNETMKDDVTLQESAHEDYQSLQLVKNKKI